MVFSAIRGKKCLRWAAWAALLLWLTALAGCGVRAQSRTFFAMDTVMAVRLYGGDTGLPAALEQEVQRLEGMLSATREDSEIAAVNRSGEGKLSPETARLVEGALALCDATGGALDITVYPILRAWGFTTGDYGVPQPRTLNELLEHIGYGRVSLAADGTVTLPEGFMLDLGAVAKGYTADRLTELLREQGVEAALLDLGGNIQAIGGNPDGGGWRVAVQKPDSEGYLGVLTLEDKAAVTSGGYQRNFVQDGTVYHHIIDPSTGMPARSGLASVTIVADSGLLADGLSTALYVMGAQKALEFWQTRSDFEAVLYGDDGTLWVTEGLAGCFEAGDPESLVVVERQP